MGSSGSSINPLPKPFRLPLRGGAVGWGCSLGQSVAAGDIERVTVRVSGCSARDSGSAGACCGLSAETGVGIGERTCRTLDDAEGSGVSQSSSPEPNARRTRVTNDGLGGAGAGGGSQAGMADAGVSTGDAGLGDSTASGVGEDRSYVLLSTGLAAVSAGGAKSYACGSAWPNSSGRYARSGAKPEGVS